MAEISRHLITCRLTSVTKSPHLIFVAAQMKHLNLTNKMNETFNLIHHLMGFHEST